MTEPIVVGEATLDTFLRRASLVISLGLTCWVVWEYLGEWRRARILSELERLLYDAPASPEPSHHDVADVLRRAEEITREGTDADGA